MIYLSRTVVALVSFNAFDSVDCYTALHWEQFDQQCRSRMIVSAISADDTVGWTNHNCSRENENTRVIITRCSLPSGLYSRIMIINT